jgi:hypothetical protein
MRIFCISFLPLAFVFGSCGDTNSSVNKDSLQSADSLNDSVNKKTIVIPEQKSISEDGLACFYFLNNNSITKVDTSRVTGWISPFIDSLNGNTVYGNDNLLNKDVGPMGARLNPRADMLVLAYFREEIDTASLVFKVNGYNVLKSALGFAKTKTGLNVCWFVLPRIRYNVMLHLPSENEIKEICQLKNCDEKTWMKNSCTAFKLSVSVNEKGKQINLEDYLLAFYAQ